MLLVGSDAPAGIALQGAFAQWGRHNPMCLTVAASRWRSERQAKKAARRGEPAVVVDLRIASLLSERRERWTYAGSIGASTETQDQASEAGVMGTSTALTRIMEASGATAGSDASETEMLPDGDLERAHWLAKACERSGIHYIFLSSDLVFSGTYPGTAARGLRETDEPDAVSPSGRQLAETERRVLQASPSAIVLRTGPIFAPSSPNLLTRVLGTMAASDHASFDDQSVFCPVAYIDLARVVAAILDQISAGATASGVFHYCSGDRTTEYGFAEATLAAASQYADCGDVVLRAIEADAQAVKRQHVLDCARLRDAFAIKQVPWRGFINATVKQFIEERQ
ncbi:MAG: sugar nucleotide-binding protein [Pseudomonadota bacterium]